LSLSAPTYLRDIGPIALLQVQPEALTGERNRVGYYDPTPLLVVPELLISAEGIIGITAEGREVLDVHHTAHRRSANSGGVNGISLGVSSHYRALRERFGEQITDGIAGENIIVAYDGILTPAEAKPGLAIQSSASGDFASLINVLVATPCIEFTQFAANAGRPMALADLKAALQFLNHGRRGFYATLAGAETVRIRTGDRVFVVDA
jgi:hypothetical protein